MMLRPPLFQKKFWMKSPLKLNKDVSPSGKGIGLSS